MQELQAVLAGDGAGGVAPVAQPEPRPERTNEPQPLVVVTGSSGLIGARVAHALAERYHVVGIDREPPRDGSEAEEWFECDLTQDQSVESALEALAKRHGRRITSVIHLAAYYDFSGEPSPLYEELTVNGTRRLLRALQSFEVEQFVFSSSLLVMKAVEEGEVIDESSPVQAEWDYPRSKLEAERVIREERGSIPAVVLRIAGVYDEDGHSVPLAQQMRRILERKLESFFFPGDPDHGQSFIHLDDLVTCFRAVVEHRDALGAEETFLIGEPDVVSYGEIQDIVGVEIFGREWPTIRIPAPLAKAGAWIKDKAPGGDPFIKPWMIDLADAHMPVSIERARTKLDWTPDHRLRSTLPAMARRLAADPRSWYEENGLELPPSFRAPKSPAEGRRDAR